MADATIQSIPTKPIKMRRAGDAQKFVGACVILGFFGVVILLCWHVVPTENKELLDTMLGFIGGAFTTTVAFYFGSTSSSHEKDATITTLAANAPPSTGDKP